MKRRLLAIYNNMFNVLGPQHWWPGRTCFEIIVGAILTQNAAWVNVEKAIKNLRAKHLLTPSAMTKVSVSGLAHQIRPSGYFNQKAKKLKNIAEFLKKYPISKLRKMELGETRKLLLEIDGVGPETADSILLYALDKPSFVVDAYTKRLLTNLKLIKEESSYDEIKDLFEKNLKKDYRLYQEFHALLVECGKRNNSA